MKNNFTKYLLLVVFFIAYILLFNFMWQYLPIDSSLGVLLGSILVLFISLVLSFITTEKLIVNLRRRS